MATDKEVEYHRSLLSPDYLDNLVPLTRSEKLRKRSRQRNSPPSYSGTRMRSRQDKVSGPSAVNLRQISRLDS